MKITYTIEILEQTKNTVHFRIKEGENLLSFHEVFDLWEESVEFVRFYVSGLNKFNFEAFYWEHPALNNEFLTQRYECILQKSKSLGHRSINEKAFADFIHEEDEVVDFMNLGKNTKLVIPTKKTDSETYNHLGKFLKLGAENQIIAVFQRVGKIVKQEIQERKLIWLNTAGGGVIWLHIRMDTKPKYYKTKSLKSPDFLGKKSKVKN